MDENVEKVQRARRYTINFADNGVIVSLWNDYGHKQLVYRNINAAFRGIKLLEKELNANV